MLIVTIYIYTIERSFNKISVQIITIMFKYINILINKKVIKLLLYHNINIFDLIIIMIILYINLITC